MLLLIVVCVCVQTYWWNFMLNLCSGIWFYWVPSKAWWLGIEIDGISKRHKKMWIFYSECTEFHGGGAWQRRVFWSAVYGRFHLLIVTGPSSHGIPLSNPWHKLYFVSGLAKMWWYLATYLFSGYILSDCGRLGRKKSKLVPCDAPICNPQECPKILRLG